MINTKFFAALATSFALFSSVHAAPVTNLLTNGSFETGTLAGWTTSGTQQTFAPSVKVTDGVTACCFGEKVPASTVVGGSPDAAGKYGVYFVDDFASQSLTQSVFLAKGSYEIGFDAYAPRNGFKNKGDASFMGKIAGVTLANYTVHTQNAPQQWFGYTGLANVLNDGWYDVSFTFNTKLFPSADVLIDRAFIVASDKTGGTDIPEPATLMLVGLALVGVAASRRRAK